MQRVEKSLNKEDRLYIVHELTCRTIELRTI